MEIKALIDKYELTGDVKGAIQNIKSGKVKLYSMSGKMGSGKDTIGSAIAKELQHKYNVAQTSFASALREEIDSIMTRVKNDDLLGIIAQDENVRLSELRNLLGFLGFDSIYDRTAKSRRAIQYWGTDVRRRQNPNYWVNKVAQFVIDEASKGNSVYVTDSRFPNEAQSIIDLGGVVIRLDVPEEVRVDRIRYRDGNDPTPSQLYHSSETSLDEFEFEFRIDGCKTPEEIAYESLRYIERQGE